MELRMNIRPNKVVADSIDGIHRKIGNHCCCIITTYGNYMHANDNYIIVVNMQKFNKKTSQIRKRGKTVSTIIRRSHWVGYVYFIPKAWFQASGMVVKQYYLS